MGHATDWANSYARQARADFQTWELLQANEKVTDCHHLLFMQMACEKLTKAHLSDAGIDPKSLHRSHAFIARNLPNVIGHQIKVSKLGKARWVLDHSGHLAREIELLAPAVRRGGQRPDNCEYPWEDADGRIYLPIGWAFTATALLLAPAGRAFLKLVRDAIERFA